MTAAVHTIWQPVLVLLLGSLVLQGQASAAAPEVDPWKYDVEIISSPRYVVNNYQTWCDGEDRLWARLSLDFGENTDAYHQRQAVVSIVSVDRGIRWRVSDQPWPGPRNDRSVLPDGMIVETGTHHWMRYPRSQIPALEKQGYYVWDLGPQANYGAILGSMWVRRSTDQGATWKAFPVHQQFGFFSRLAVNSPPHQRYLRDGTLIQFAHGYRPADRTAASDLGGRNHPFILRSADAGQTWQLVQMADGAGSPSARGFNEIYPVVWGDGRIFAMLRTAAGQQAFSVASRDGGRTWSAPRPTPIFAKHPNPTILNDKTIVCSYQRRFAAPFGVRARFTADVGTSWSPEVILRDDVVMADGLVQPQTVEFSDGLLFTLFTAQKRTTSGAIRSFIGGTAWRRDQQPIPHIAELRRQINQRGSWSPTLPLPPLAPRYNHRRAEQSPWTEVDPARPGNE